MNENQRQQEKLPVESSDVLDKSPSQLRSMIDLIPAISWSCLPNGAVNFLNRQWCDYTGIFAGASDGAEWQTAVHPDDLNALNGKWLSDLEARNACQFVARLRRFDGAYRWFLFRYEPVRDDSGNIVEWCGMATDIDDLKCTEQNLRQEREEFRAITDAIPQYIVVLSPDGKVLYTNQVVFAQTGLTVEDVGKDDSFWLPFHPDDIERVRAERSDGLSQGLPFELEVRVLLTNGQYRWHLVQYNPQHDEAGRIIRWYATGTDIDGQKKTEGRLRNENVVLREEVDGSSMFEELVGSSEPMRRALRHVEKVAPSDATVLILGETGTGKELIARALHRRSKRSARAFIRVNCAAIPDALIASELFGHEKGAFTGASQRRIGRFEAADGGTLFLDEVGELSSETQIALLRVLQERELERVGSNQPISVDVRLIAATNRDLSAAVAAGTFREDLFYRLNVFPIEVPPLRERTKDIGLLVRYFVERYAKKAGKKIRHIRKETLEYLSAYRWPGNIRELQNVVERAVILCDTDTFSVDETWLKPNSVSSATQEEGLANLAAREVQIIEAALAESGGRISGPSGAAAKLGIPRQTLESKIRRLGIGKRGL